MYKQSENNTVFRRNLAHIIGKAISDCRRKRNISQSELALSAGVDRSYMGRIERGEVSITIEKLYRIANSLDCRIRDILPSSEEIYRHD